MKIERLTAIPCSSNGEESKREQKRRATFSICSLRTLIVLRNRSRERKWLIFLSFVLSTAMALRLIRATLLSRGPRGNNGRKFSSCSWWLSAILLVTRPRYIWRAPSPWRKLSYERRDGLVGQENFFFGNAMSSIYLVLFHTSSCSPT